MKRAIALTGAAATVLALTAGPQSAAASVGQNSPAGSVDKSATGSYVVVMQADPLLKEFKQSELASSAAKSRRSQKKAAQDKALAAADISTANKTTSFTNALDGFAVRTDLAGANRLAKQAGVAAVLPDELRYPQAIADDLEARMQSGDGGAKGANALNNFLGLTDKKGAYAKGVTGEGVVVGVIDTGIWPEQPMLADDGSFPKAPALDSTTRSACDFGNTAFNPNDKPFTCNNKLIGARTFLDTYKRVSGLTSHEFDSARDSEGHGTHTATTAAGNANVQSVIQGVNKDIVSGIAPRAQVIAYKALGDGGGYTSDLSAAIDQAVADGVDVINYSIGGGARVVSADTLSFLFAADAGVFAAVSAGNSGPGPKTVGGPANVPWVTGVGATTLPRNYAGSIVLGNGKTYRGTSVTKGTGVLPIIDAAKAGAAGAANPGMCVAGSLDPAKVAGKIVLCERGINGRVAKGGEVARAGGAGMILFNHVDVDTMFSDTHFVPTVMIDKTPGEEIRAWVNSTANPTARLRNDGINTLPFYSPTMTYFSSRGETVPNGDIIKPDISAPGAQIMAGQTPMPAPGSAPAGDLFQAIAGTSMSGPVVAGTYALIKQAHPDWSPAAAKSALMTTAFTKVRDNDRVSMATPFATGSGMAYLGEPGKKGTTLQPGLVYDAGFNEYLGFLCAEGREAFGNPARTCANLAAAGIPTTSANLNYPSMGMEAVPGKMTVTRTLTNVSGRDLTVEADTKAPAGYRVQVTPARLKIAAGASANFQVTVTNRTAPLGQWAFGSLTWSGAGYDVRSPIAVKGVAIATDAVVTGSGTSGTATVAATLGQAGTYTAVPHGLVPATDNNGTVAQDPDQTYPSPDDGAGVARMPVTLTGVDHARWTLKLGGESDLDIYLLDAAGKLVASSTNGGTDEQIDLEAPADGQYTMVVHGWAVGATPVDFNLRSWLVPTATGGSLSVASGSPTTVTAGQTVDVGLSWAGLTTGGDYLGTVSHLLNGTKVGSTLVAVTG